MLYADSLFVLKRVFTHLSGFDNHIAVLFRHFSKSGLSISSSVYLLSYFALCGIDSVALMPYSHRLDSFATGMFCFHLTSLLFPTSHNI